jgi:glutathione-specific gamma-glutamylcyclotransferase
MALTREDLINDVLHKTHVQPAHPLLIMPDAELHASLDRLLAQHPRARDVWVFAYGSLIWNPLFRYQERRLAVVHGYHRSFCLRSRLWRGSIEKPGLVLGLDFGGSCTGIAFRIAARNALDELRLLWRREMVLGSYAPRWVTLRSSRGKVRAIAFIVNHDHPHYAAKLPEQTVLQILETASGRFGSCAEYLEQTVAGLERHGIRDARLIALYKLLRMRRPPTGASVSPPPNQGSSERASRSPRAVGRRRTPSRIGRGQ